MNKTLFVPCVINLVQVVFPREILISLEEMRYAKTNLLAIAMCIIVLLLNIFTLLVEYRKYSYSGEFTINLNKLLVKATATWSYQNFESFSCY